MSQRQLKQFRQRLKRIARIHRRGGGFEAAGTLGQSFYTRQAKRQQRPVLRPAITIVATLVTMKAVAAASMEEGAYAARVANLSGGTAIERAGALVMKPDPISRTLAQWMQPLIGPET